MKMFINVNKMSTSVNKIYTQDAGKVIYFKNEDKNIDVADVSR